MNRPLLILTLLLTLAGCQNGQRVQSNVDGKEGCSELQSQDYQRDKSRQQARAIRSAVTNHLALYPEAHLQDLYKAFFQAEFGAEHIVADTTAAGRYLDRELATPDSSAILFEPIGADSAFYRVHLRAVQEGLITRDQLFQAFVGGVHVVEIPQIENWAQKWPQIIKVIDGMHLDLPDYDSERAAIDSLISRGKYATHHSEAFGKAYKPHYRIIRRDIFETQILPHL